MDESLWSSSKVSDTQRHSSSAFFKMEPPKKRRSSPVWEHFELVSPNKVKCLLCLKTLTYSNNTSSMLRHYRAVHETPNQPKPPDRQNRTVPSQTLVRAMSSSNGPTSPYTTLSISHPAESVTHVEFHRPEKRNAMNKAFWSEMVSCFNEITVDPDCRAVVFSAAGKLFTAGIDLMDMAGDILQPEGDDTARISWNLRRTITNYQEAFSVIEKCPKPVLVAVHGACIGGGVDLITACDIRLCTQDAYFQVKEVDVGLAADVGTLQRLPKVIGSRSLVNELALTARKMFADEAKSSGLVSRVLPNKEEMMAEALRMAGEIAERSPVAVQGTKLNLLYARDHSVADALNYMATWNMSMLQTQDVMKSAQVAMEKKTPKAVTFSKL